MLLPFRGAQCASLRFYYLLLIFQLHIFTSVTNMCPGAWVMQNSGLECITTFCGVTPQGQNTGVSPGLMVTASP